MSNDIIAPADSFRVVLSKLGLEGERVGRVLIYMGAGPEASPWDYMQHDPDALIIRVWDAEDQRAICDAVGMDASALQFLVLSFKYGRMVTYVAEGLAREGVGGGLAKVLEGIVGGPLTSTRLPAGRLSMVGVNVPGEVVASNRHISATRPGPLAPYTDLDKYTSDEFFVPPPQ